MVVVGVGGLVIVQPVQPVTHDQAKVPLEPVPAIVNDVELPVAHLVWSEPAFTTGTGFTVSTTSSVGVPQPSVVSVARNVAVAGPRPAYTMVVVGLGGVVVVQAGPAVAHA